MITQIYNAYDIHLNSNNELMISKFKVYDENIEDARGKLRTNRHYDYMGVEVPNDVEERIFELMQEGYLPMNRFRPISFDVDTKNPLVYAKALLLGYHHQMLEKFYQVGSGYDYDVATYITYIDMNTGKISVMKVDRIKFCNEDQLKELENKGYISFERSFYCAYSKENEEHLTR